jgi:hypothetical protein
VNVELFDQNIDPTVRLVLDIYNDKDDFISNWWMELNPDIPVTKTHLRGILLSIPSIERQIEKLIDLLDEPE